MSCAIRVLEHRQLPWWLGALAFALASRAIGIGLVLDDYFHQASLLALPQLPELMRTPFELFAFVGNHWAVQLGLLPWWASPELRVAFFRPLTGITHAHALDLALWRDQPHWMHIHSLLWMAAAVVAAAHLYRRLSSQSLAPWVAGLAGLGFALDDAHATPAGWIANRNATVAAVFAIASIVVYDRWRRDDWRPGRWLTPLFLGLGLLGGEGAVGGGLYLLSYALFIDRGSLRKRLSAIAPPAAVGVVWWLAYQAMGYGASNSALYTDPGSRPLSFFGAVLERAPLLLMGQVGFPPSEMSGVASHQVARGLWLFAVAGLTVLAALVWPLLRRVPTARFWALGMVLSLLPVCATVPSDRLLVMPGLGGMALIALFVATAFGDAGQAPSLTWRRLARPLACVLLVVHLVLAPLFFVRIVAALADAGATIRKAAATFPAEPIVHDGVIIEVLELTDDARPAAVSFRFPYPLEDPHWRWIRWHRSGFVESQPPSIGKSVRLGSFID